MRKNSEIFFSEECEKNNRINTYNIEKYEQNYTDYDNNQKINRNVNTQSAHRVRHSKNEFSKQIIIEKD